MARPSFTFWEDYYTALRKLRSDQQRGEFIMGICQWAFEGCRPDFSHDDLLDIALTMVEGSIEESVAIRRRSSEAGKRSGEARRKKSLKKNEHPSEGCSNTPSNVSKYVSTTTEDTYVTYDTGGAAAPDGRGATEEPTPEQLQFMREVEERNRACGLASDES